MTPREAQTGKILVRRNLFAGECDYGLLTAAVARIRVYILSYILCRSEMLKMGRRNCKSATKKRQKLVIEFDERKRAYAECFA